MEQQQAQLKKYFILAERTKKKFVYILELVEKIEDEANVYIETTIMALDFEDAHKQFINYTREIN